MDPITLGLILAGAGTLKGLTIDRQREDSDRRLAAETQRYSPWTGLAAGSIREADPLANALTYGAQGAAFGQNMQAQSGKLEEMAAQRDLLKARTNALNLATGGPQTPGSVPGMISPWSINPRLQDQLNFDYRLRDMETA